MADDKNSFKYLRYAIGEIVLVVVGILIALQINNWNEDRKQQLQGINFLKNLRNEIKLDTSIFAERTIEYTAINNRLSQTLSFFKGQSEVSESERKTIMSALRNTEVLTPAYKNIERNDIKLADGTLDNINSELNQKYMTYIENIKSNNDIISKLGESMQNVVLKDLYSKVDLDYTNISDKKVHFVFEEIRNDRGINNAINRSIASRNFYMDFMDEQIEQAIELLDMLNEELK